MSRNRKEYDKEYYLKNREKILERSKIKKSNTGKVPWNKQPENEKTKYKEYRYLVDKLSEVNYVRNYDTINPEHKPRTKCGVEGGYQLDHIYPVYEGYVNNIPPEEIAKLENLRVIPWEENQRKKHNLL